MKTINFKQKRFKDNDTVCTYIKPAEPVWWVYRHSSWRYNQKFHNAYMLDWDESYKENTTLDITFELIEEQQEEI